MTHRDDAGNVQVDFVWGNLPMQPDDDRDTNLDPALDNHVIATTGYSNFPGYIPNYAGDDDTGLEFVVPNVLRKSLNEADALITAAGGQMYAVNHNLTISYLESTGTTLRVTAYDTEYANWANTSGAALVGLRVGDEVNFSVNYDSDPLSLPSNSVVTNVNNDGNSSWFEIKTPTDLGLDGAADGTVYAGNNIVDVVTVVRPNTGPGTIQDEGRNINVRYIGD
jgi:hypothetical protein